MKLSCVYSFGGILYKVARFEEYGLKDALGGDLGMRLYTTIKLLYLIKVGVPNSCILTI